VQRRLTDEADYRLVISTRALRTEKASVFLGDPGNIRTKKVVLLTEPVNKIRRLSIVRCSFKEDC